MALMLCFLFVHLVAFVYSNGDYQNDKLVSVTATIGMPWPLPQQYSSTPAVYTINRNVFKFRATDQSCDILESAFFRYQTIIFGYREKTLRFHPKLFLKAGSLTVLDVNVKSKCDRYPYLGMDESYNLTIGAAGATLNSNSVWGALRGIETFSQLVLQQNKDMFTVNGTTISDFPRFQHRGLLLDTSRHFLDVSVIKQNLLAMSQSKFNVFHWHIVDDQSFPYTSVEFPDMSSKGAYDSRHIYTQDQIAEIIEFARILGIRVIPEFDSPGHSQSWGKAIKDLLTKCYSGSQPNGQYGPINPSLESSYSFLSKFFAGVAKVFPDHYLHLGGDEVNFDCWKSNPNITAFMKQKSFGTNYVKLEEYYVQRLLDIIGGMNKGYMIWQEVVDNGAKISKEAIVEIYRNLAYMQDVYLTTLKGYRTVLQACWYLDLIKYGVQWQAFYACDPGNFNGTAAQKKLVIGGETCMWGEYVDNANVLSRTWPRASVVAERLWSAQSVNNANAAAPRLEEHRCRMIKRGFPAETVNGPGYCPQEYSIPV
ncbi:beta-hexosaminidase subunit beta-like isoform X1 [Ostrea edulis]|uniref:beta-hexosaminidase subunit beta-like isoform X1 n=1 Tax=Ostrea edulis TaxID=37623 RepID=UPI0024AF63FB|nr:beta-hexosaminidase subunit beta-like isoform X1 [Ostrea edulis]